MKPLLTALALLCAFAALPARADIPRVATDIPAVHSLVAQVMGDLGTPQLLITAGASPHGYSMRPSQARDLAEADILVWMGAAQMPWLAKAQSALAANAVSIELMQLPDTIVLPPREGLGFAAHDDHADHSDHAPDPHAWLDPVNAQLWLAHIATALAAHDPDNAATYTANAEAATATLQKLQSDIATQLAPLQQVGFVVFHDAYQYFEARFGLHAIAALSQSDASTPGPSRVSDLRGILFSALVKCAFAEPQFNPRLMATLIEGTDIRTGILDPMGASLISGPMLYDNLLRGMADEMVKCLG